MKEAIFSADGPMPGGPYSPAIRANGFVFVSGQIGVNPETGEIPHESLEQQIRFAVENACKVLESAGTSLSSVVKSSVFLSDIDDFDEMNRIYSELFPEPRPARTTIQAARLPKGVKFEIDLIALASH